MAFLIPGIAPMLILATSAALPAEVATDEPVEVRVRLRSYVIGLPTVDDSEDLEYIRSSEPELASQVGGFVLVIESPKEHRGRRLTMHHDGILASGDPFAIFDHDHVYLLSVPRSSIGDNDFRLCSACEVRPIPNRPGADRAASVRPAERLQP